jgi:hypothetical protein
VTAMRFHAVYRSTGLENQKKRPAFYSKLLSLISFLEALEGSPARGETIFINDGPVPEDRFNLMERSGEVIQLPRVGKFRSYRTALSLVDSRNWNDEDLVYFSEDDYLYRRSAFEFLMAAAQEIPEASYFTFYDYPGWYTDHDPSRGIRWFSAAGRRWRSIESTCLTFGAPVGVMRIDGWVHWLATRERVPGARLTARGRDSFALTKDRATWCALQGYGPYRLLRGFIYVMGADSGIATDYAIARFNLGTAPFRSRFRSRYTQRLLVCSAPALATHLEEPYLSLGVDWEAVAEEILRRAERRGIVPQSLIRQRGAASKDGS